MHVPCCRGHGTVGGTATLTLTLMGCAAIDEHRTRCDSSPFVDVFDNEGGRMYVDVVFVSLI